MYDSITKHGDKIMKDCFNCENRVICSVYKGIIKATQNTIGNIFPHGSKAILNALQCISSECKKYEEYKD